MALDLQQFSNAPEQCYIVSLEGEAEQLFKRWPRLIAVQERLVFLNKKPGISPKTLVRLIEVFKRLEPNVVHTHHIGPLFYGGIAARKAGVNKVVHTEHDALHLKKFKRRALTRLLLKFVDPVLVAHGVVVADELAEKLKYGKTRIIQNGIDINRFCPGNKLAAKRCFNMPENALVIGSTGPLDNDKGHIYLLKAMKNMPSNVVLVLAGTGEQVDALKHYVWRHHLVGRVYFAGEVDDLPLFYRAIDVFCLPSLKEDEPLCTLEAQASGVPVVASNVGGIKQTLCPDSSKLFEAGNVTELTKQLKTTVVLLQREVAMPQFFGTGYPMYQQLYEKYHDHMNSDCSVSQMTRQFVTDHNDVHTMVSRYMGIY
ncbi:MAG: glycosyltransferase, partial [Psychrosphaera sp.]|nr:glycosyltransferase [Psychrosphaera sp.]